jgi:hypothetical protein
MMQMLMALWVANRKVYGAHKLWKGASPVGHDIGRDQARFTERLDELELATLSWVHWFNHERLDDHCDHVPPSEFEAAFYAARETHPAGVGIQ